MVVHDMEFGLTSRENSPHREAPNRHERGSKKYLKMVDESSKKAASKNLPFTFSKPKRSENLAVWCQCPSCDRVSHVGKNTVMVACVDCKSLYEVEDNLLEEDTE
jgi:hypothetical protein